MKLFVYGSLRMGLYNYELYLKGKSHFLGYGYVIGELYSLKERSYPALLPGILDEQGTQLDILPVYWYHVERPGNRELLDEIIQEHDFTAYCKAKAN